MSYITVSGTIYKIIRCYTQVPYTTTSGTIYTDIRCHTQSNHVSVLPRAIHTHTPSGYSRILTRNLLYYINVPFNLSFHSVTIEPLLMLKLPKMRCSSLRYRVRCIYSHTCPPFNEKSKRRWRWYGVYIHTYKVCVFLCRSCIQTPYIFLGLSKWVTSSLYNLDSCACFFFVYIIRDCYEPE